MGKLDSAFVKYHIIFVSQGQEDEPAYSAIPVEIHLLRLTK